MNKNESIRACKKMWEEIERSGLGKWDFLETPRGGKWKDKGYRADCPLCEYADSVGDGSCLACPLLTQYGRNCSGLGFRAISPSKASFFEAVKGLKED